MSRPAFWYTLLMRKSSAHGREIVSQGIWTEVDEPTDYHFIELGKTSQFIQSLREDGQLFLDIETTDLYFWRDIKSDNFSSKRWYILKRDSGVASPVQMRAAMEDVMRAIDDAGTHPIYHQTVLSRHETEWPTLWKAIRKILLIL